MPMSAATSSKPARCLRYAYFAPCRARRMIGRAEPGDANGGSTADRVEAPDDAARWKQIDDQIRSEMMGYEVQETLPLPFLATVSTFGTALTGYLTWRPVPLSALGLLGYATVASLCFCSIALKSQRPTDAPEASMWLTRAQQGILYGSSILAGTSIALAVTLKTEFPDEACAFCIASIAASLTLYFTSFFSSQDKSKSLSFGSVAATTLLITGFYATYPENVTARSEIPFTEPQVTTESPAGAVDLARALQFNGAKMYGAFWCSHCFEQKQAFGLDAKADLPYVECYPDGYTGPRSIARACLDADIQGFPTWIINGQKVEGDWPLPYLQSVLEGADPSLEARKYP